VGGHKGREMGDMIWTRDFKRVWRRLEEAEMKRRGLGKYKVRGIAIE